MYWHCGLLDDPGLPIEKQNPIRHSNWHTLPAVFERELRIWLAMPGFKLSYHVETLQREPRLIRQFMGGYAELEEDVLLNWVSATRDDCIKLGCIRPEKGDVPLIAKIEMRRDYMRAMAQTEIAEEYGVWPATAHKLAWGIPDEVSQLPPRLQEILNKDPNVNAATRFQAHRLAELAETERQLALARARHPKLSPEMMEKVSDGLIASAERVQREEAQNKAAAAKMAEKVTKAVMASSEHDQHENAQKQVVATEMVEDAPVPALSPEQIARILDAAGECSHFEPKQVCPLCTGKLRW